MRARKKPVEIEYYPVSREYREQIEALDRPERPVTFDDLDDCLGNVRVRVATLEGDMFATVDDVIIVGVNGEVYPCKRDIFEKTYDLI